MADPRPSETLLRLELLQHTLAAVKSYEIDSTYITSTDGWSFTVVLTPDERQSLGRLELMPVEISVDGQQQVLGRIERTEIGNEGTAIALSGRDYIADLVECHVDPLLRIKEQMSVGDAVRLAAGPVGITAVKSGKDVALRNVRSGKSLGGGAGKDFVAFKMQDFKPQPGSGVYEFCARIATRHGATVQPALSRDTLTLDAPDYTSSPVGRIVRTASTPESVNNNVLSASASRDFSQFPTVALFTGKQARPGDTSSRMSSVVDFVTLAEAFSSELAEIVDRVHELRGELARRKPGAPPGLAKGQLYRLMYLRDENSRNPEQLERAAKRAVANRLKETLSYRATLRGHADPETGALWSTNTMVDVKDEITGVDERLWIERRTFRYSESEGATTSIEAWRPESFQIGD